MCGHVSGVQNKEAGRAKEHVCVVVYFREVHPCPDGHIGLAESFGVWLFTFILSLLHLSLLPLHPLTFPSFGLG